MNKLNMIEVLKDGLEQAVKKAILEKIIKEQLEELEETLRKILPTYINEISFTKIEGLKNYMCIRDELHIFLHYKNNTIGKVLDSEN